ncbi:MAG: hypothetical protein D6722_10775, partial [Bacteroidetes bacterium]
MKNKSAGAPWLLLWLLILGGLTTSAQPEGWYDARTYGLPPDSSRLASPALQAAIDAAHAAGGGTVYVPSGTYLCGAIQLKSHVTLHLEAGCDLVASRRKEDFGPRGFPHKQLLMVWADSAEHIALEGKGRLIGQARRTYEPLRAVDDFIADYTERARQAGVEMKRYYKVGPLLTAVNFSNCREVRVQDVSIIDFVFWNLHVQGSERVRIEGICLFTDLEAGVNADGIDIDGCRDVLIRDCIVTAGDDAIVLKANYTGEHQQHTENVVVSDCIVQSTSTGLKIGTESYGDFRHILFTDCVVRGSNRGLSIVVRDGATVESVIFENITVETDRKHFNWWGNGDPIWVVLLKRRPNSQLGYIRDVVFRNILAQGQGTSWLEGYAPDSLHPEGRALENIRLEDVQIRMEAEDYPDKRATHILGAQHVDGLALEDLRLDWRPPAEAAWASALYLKSVRDLRVDGLAAAPKPALAQLPLIQLEDVQEALLTDIRPLAPVPVLLSAKGQISDVLIRDSDPLGRATQRILLGEGL